VQQGQTDTIDAMRCDAMSGKDSPVTLLPRLASEVNVSVSVSSPLRLTDPCTQKKQPSTHYMLLGRFDHPRLRCSRRPDAQDAQRRLVGSICCNVAGLAVEQDRQTCPPHFDFPTTQFCFSSLRIVEIRIRRHSLKDTQPLSQKYRLRPPVSPRPSVILRKKIWRAQDMGKPCRIMAWNIVSVG
jgi:hypothetical protein